MQIHDNLIKPNHEVAVGHNECPNDGPELLKFPGAQKRVGELTPKAVQLFSASEMFTSTPATVRWPLT